MNLQSAALLAARIALHRCEPDEAHPRVDAPLARCLESIRALDAAWRNVEAAGVDAPSALRHTTTGLEASVLTEVLLCELPTRIAAARLGAERNARPSAVEPVIGHSLVKLLTRKRELLQRLLAGGRPLGELVRADRLRRRCERWTDLLLARLPEHPRVAELAISVSRLREHRQQAFHESTRLLDGVLIRAGIARSFRNVEIAPDRLELLAAYVQGVAGLFPGAGDTMPDEPVEEPIRAEASRPNAAPQSRARDALTLRFRRLMDGVRDHRAADEPGRPDWN